VRQIMVKCDECGEQTAIPRHGTLLGWFSVSPRLYTECQRNNEVESLGLRLHYDLCAKCFPKVTAAILEKFQAKAREGSRVKDGYCQLELRIDAPIYDGYCSS
jgi:hypothetical protein